MSIVIVGAGSGRRHRRYRAARAGPRRPGRARRRRAARALRAAAAVEGLPAGQRPDRRRLRAPPEWYAEHDVDLRLGVEATAVDTDAKVVHTAPGDLTYDRLLLATGAEPRRLALAEESGVPLPTCAHRGQRPAQGGLRRRGPDRRRRRRLDRPRGGGGGAHRRVRGDRLRDRRPAPAAGARADRGAGVRRPAPLPRRRPAPGHPGERRGPGRRRPRRRGRRGHAAGGAGRGRRAGRRQRGARGCRAAHVGAERARHRGHRQPRPPGARSPDPGRALGHRHQPGQGGRPQPRGWRRGLRRAAVLLHRPVRPRHGVRRQCRRRRRGRRAREPGELEFRAFWLREGRVVAAMHANDWDATDDLRAAVASGDLPPAP